MAKRSRAHDDWIVFLAYLTLVLPSAAWYGFALSELWRWFVIPLGVTSIGVWEGAGLYLVARFLVLDYDGPGDDRTAVERLGRAIARTVLIPALALAVGALYHTLSHG